VTISVLLRVVPAALADDRLAGEVEVVETGQRLVVRSAEELIAYLRASAEAADRRDAPTTAAAEASR
jgi:hypothetical protein